MELGKQIKKYRNEIKLSQDGLAEKIFVSRQTISNWENDKNYPDVKSLLLLSSLFNVSLDILIKGDLEEMKEKIKTEDIERFKHEGNIFGILMVSLILLPIPLAKYLGYIGIGIYVILFIIAMTYALRVEKLKKDFDIQTYKEILAFTEGKNITEIEKNREYGKRPYQNFLLTLGVSLLTLVVTLILGYLI